jgi:hypothetical protein
MGETYRSALTESDLVSGDVALVVGQFVKLGERKIEAGELLAIGYGMQSGQNNAQGRIFMDLRDNAAAPGVEVNGTVRLQVHSPQNRPIKILGEWRTETLRSGETDRALMIPLPENFTWLSEDKKLVLELQADAAATLGKANSGILMDTTTEGM